VASGRSLWIVTDADLDGPLQVAKATFIEADTAEDAAAAGMWALWADYMEDVGASPPTHAYAVEVPRSALAIYRATVGAERVPDEFQCCGGMPSDTIGTYDQHTAICQRDVA
jgi:hypothetical protein